MMIDAEYFDDLYKSNNITPWQNEDIWYEERKRNLILASLTKQNYHHICELGCGIGFVTEQLAKRTKQLFSCDFSKVAINLAKQQLASYHHINFQCLKLPEDWPTHLIEKFDLIVISEIAYYLTDKDFKQLIQHSLKSLDRGGELLLCNWLPDCHDRLQDTHSIHQQIHQHHDLEHHIRHLDKLFLIDIWFKK